MSKRTTEKDIQNQKIFQVTKAITKYIAYLNKTIEGVFSDTEEIIMLKEMRDTSEHGISDQPSIREFCEMLQSIIEETRGKKKLELTNLCAKRLIEILQARDNNSRQGYNHH